MHLESFEKNHCQQTFLCTAKWSGQLVNINGFRIWYASTTLAALSEITEKVNSQHSEVIETQNLYYISEIHKGALYQMHIALVRIEIFFNS